MTFARAVITTEFAKDKYRPLVVDRVEDFSIDSSMDTDADSWSLTVGVSRDDIIDLLRRDNEVRVVIYGLDRKEVAGLHRGFADEIYVDENGSVHLSGRDVTAPAQDSQAPPKKYKNVQPEKLVAKQCRELKIGDRLRLANIKPFKNFYNDGSESYWESWYRLYRHRQMWMWAEPDGYIVGDMLNYSDIPVYRFGKRKGHSGNWIAVESVQWRKTTTARIYDVWIYGTKGGAGFVSKAQDPTIHSWIKRPNKIVESSAAHNQNEAKRMAWEEIFEGKVGSIEISLTIANPGFIIRQNRMAQINLPELGLGGVWYIVGTRMVGGTEGIFQQVRLREKNYAITRRVPDDPKLREQVPQGQATEGGVTDEVGKALGVKWGTCFNDAALKYHGAYPYPLYLAVLLAMGEVETGFRNVRVSGNVEWYAPPSIVIKGAEEKIRKWRELFENENPTRAVGPMQLYSSGYKHWADDMGSAQGTASVGHDQYLGGRWQPCNNIMAGARALTEDFLKGIQPSDENIYIGVRSYNGAGPAAEKYMRDVKRLVDNKYMKKVEAAIAKGQAIDKDPASGGYGKNASQLAQKIRDYALAQKDKTYTWGGYGNPGYDCSGLAAMAYWAAGLGKDVGLPGGPGHSLTTYAFWASGSGYGVFYAVHKNALLPGDLVFFRNSGSPLVAFNKGGNPEHMGVYLGDGQFIAARSSRVIPNIGIDSIAGRDDYMGAIRDPHVWPGSVG
jgi:cell wall-associated NlpC family hydrolase/prophage tail gpP-like protein